MSRHNEHDEFATHLAHSDEETRELAQRRYSDARSADAQKLAELRDRADLRELVMQRSKKSLGRTAGLPLMLDGAETGERLALAVRSGRVELVLIEDQIKDARAIYSDVDARAERVVTDGSDLAALSFTIETGGVPRVVRVSIARLMEATVRAVVKKLPRVSVHT